MISLSTLSRRPFSATFQRLVAIYRQNAALFIGITALIQVPSLILRYVLGLPLLAAQSDPAYESLMSGATVPDASQVEHLLNLIVLPTLGLIVVTLVTILIEVVLVDAPITYISAESEFGRQPTFAEALAAVRARMAVIVGGVITYGVLLIGLGFALLMAFVLTGAISQLLFFAFWGGLFVTVFVLTWPLLVPVLVLEQTAGVQAVRRSFELTKVRLWPILGLTAGLALITNLVLPVIAGLFGTSPTGDALTSIFTGIVGILLGPVPTIGYTLFYLEARVRKEGLDKALEAIPNGRPIHVLPPPTSGPLIASEDWINLGIVFVSIFILILLLMALGFGSAGIRAVGG
ncbi:MAG TPA: hypothetical protein VMT34_16330 [Aggregatilineales bacterium]|nr:hypothetical protein [Aggregatilineales bacterium]